MLEKARIGKLRGAVVVGIALIMGANLLSPAVAHVTRRLNHLLRHLDPRYVNVGEKATDADRLDGIDSTGFIPSGVTILRSDPALSISAGGFGGSSVACPAGHVAVGGGGAGNWPAANLEMEASYPSNGATNSPGHTGWTAVFQNDSGVAQTVRTYVICARATVATSNYTPGGPLPRGDGSRTG